MKKMSIVLSCEHAVNTVPPKYNTLFRPYKDLLETHRSIDFGALSIANSLKGSLNCDLVVAKVSRLVIDCNRSLNHPQCFSEVTKPLSLEEKEELINHYYLPFRSQVKDLIQNHIEQGFQVWHLSIHSFTPIFEGVARNADIGLLYDPKRPLEKEITKHWYAEIKKHSPEYRVRKNYPYAGTSDGHTTALRKQFNPSVYAGIEVESNQNLCKNAQNFTDYQRKLTFSLMNILQNV